MMSEVSILLVGHCGPDAFMLKSMARSFAPGAEIIMVNDEQALVDQLGAAKLMLVNRVLDGAFESEDGIGLIEQHAQRAAGKFMLVSNFDDAQERALAVGAVPGFGKTNMRSDETRERIESALA